MTVPIHAERRRFTADEVLAMVRAGVLGEDEPVELLSGELVLMVPQGPSHSGITVIVHQALAEVYRELAYVQDHSPIWAGVDSLPEPDIAVVRGRPHDYLDHLPRGPQVVLVAEVVVTSERPARDKALIYARAGIGTYWLVHVRERYFDVHTDPSPEGYRSVVRVEEPGVVDCPETDASLAVAELLV
jgi:Uma2 family endonuclease